MSEEFIAGSRLYPLAGSIERDESVFGYRSMRRLICPVCGLRSQYRRVDQGEAVNRR